MSRRADLDIPLPGVMPATGPSYRVPRRKTGLEGNPRRMLMIAGGLTAAIIAVIAIASFTSGPRRTGIPVVEADSRPVRERPLKAGGLEVEGADAPGAGSVPDAQAKIAPPPEAPAIAALKQQQAAAAAAAAPKPQPVSLTTAPAPTTPAQPPAPVVLAAPPQPAAEKPATAPPPAAAKPATGRAQVQLAAVGSEQDAMSEWKRLERRMPDLLGGRQPAVQKIERDGRTLWRLRTGAFTDAAEATKFCESVRAKGNGCTVASF